MSANGAVDIVRQGELEQEIVDGIQAAMAEVDDWIVLNCFFTQAGTYTGGVIDWFRPDISGGSVAVPPAVMERFETLRDAMWNPETRPWLSVHVQGDPAGTFSFSFNYDRRFDIEAFYRNALELTPYPVPTDEDLIGDLVSFPRSSEMIPRWYPVEAGGSSVLPDDIAESGATPVQAALVAHGKHLMRLLEPEAPYGFELLPDDNAVRVWQDSVGGGQIVIGRDGMMLFDDGSLGHDSMLEQWRSEERSTIDHITRAVERRRELRRP